LICCFLCLLLGGYFGEIDITFIWNLDNLGIPIDDKKRGAFAASALQDVADDANFTVSETEGRARQSSARRCWTGEPRRAED